MRHRAASCGIVRHRAASCGIVRLISVSVSVSAYHVSLLAVPPKLLSSGLPQLTWILDGSSEGDLS